MIKSFETLNSR